MKNPLTPTIVANTTEKKILFSDSTNVKNDNTEKKNVFSQAQFVGLTKYFMPEGNALTVNHSFGKETANRNATRSANKLIANFFSPINALAGKPVITLTTETVIVHVFYYIPATRQALNNNTVNNLGEALSSLFNKTVELRLVKLHYPFLNCYILAQYIAYNTQDYKLVQITRRIFGSISPVKNTQFSGTSGSLSPARSSLPSPTPFGAVVGIKVRVSGRLITERSRPRQTVQTVQVGSFAKNNLSFVESASFTTKNKKGAFTVKVWITQRAVV